MTTLSWVIAIVGFSALILLHEAGHFVAAKAVGMRVERFALFFPPLILRKKVGETEYALGAIPLGGYVRISGMNPAEDLPDEVRTRAYHAQPVWKRIVVIAAGPAVNLVLGFLLLFLFFWLIGPRGIPTPEVDVVSPTAPAAGKIEPGDRVLGPAGWRVATPPEGEPYPVGASEEISLHACANGSRVHGCQAVNPVALQVQKPGGEVKTVVLRPEYDGTVKRMRVGFEFLPEPREQLPLGEALIVSLDRVIYISGQAFTLPAKLIDPVQREEISGFVGSVEMTRQTFLKEPADTVAILAVISLSLAIINLFPFLPLDGGHIFWAVVEKVRRKPVSYGTMERAGAVGLMLLLPLMLIGLNNDVGRLLNGGIGPPI